MPSAWTDPAASGTMHERLAARRAGAGSPAWNLVVDRGSPSGDGAPRPAGWSAPDAIGEWAQHLSLTVTRAPSTQGRRDRQVTVGVRLQF